MVTHFIADREMGYLSQSQNFAPGDEPKWQDNWPTKKPDILMEKPLESIQPTVVYDDKEKLNLTSILLPVEPLKEEHGLDLNPPKLEKELVNPVVLEVINGEAPLLADTKKKTDTLGFETVNKFIPSDFPIVPFELPHDDIALHLSGDLSGKPMHVVQSTDEDKYDHHKLNNAEKDLTHLEDDLPTDNDKYVKSQLNNDEKSLPPEAFANKTNNENNVPKMPQGKSLKSFEANTDWYDKVIKQNRQKYLDTVQ